MTEKPFRYTKNAEKVIRDAAESTAPDPDQLLFENNVHYRLAEHAKSFMKQLKKDNVVLDPKPHLNRSDVKVIYGKDGISATVFYEEKVLPFTLVTEEDRKDNIIRIVKSAIAAHSSIDDEHGIAILDCNDVDHIAEEIAENIAKE